MSERDDDVSRHRVPAIILACVILMTASSCATTGDSSGPKLGPAPLPTYKVGTTFKYADGTWEKVTAIEPGMVTWTDNRGATFSRSPDFTYGAAKWHRQTVQGTRRYMLKKGLIVKKRTSLWPLQKDNAVSYTEMGNWQRNEEPARSYQVDWSCRVEGTERVSVLAGEFDAWKIVCIQSTVPGSTGSSRILETKTWYYSPEIEHPVLITSHYHRDRRSERLELKAVLPPNDGTAADTR
jgi:hypothetical protein